MSVRSLVEGMRTAPVLVTGTAGWLGRALVDTLTRGDGTRQLRGLVLPGEGMDLTGIQRVEGDVRSPESLSPFFQDAQGGILFHLAGVIHPRRSADFEAVNTAGTRHVLEAARRAGVRRAVVMSSNSPLGTNPHPDHLFDETSPHRPYMGYGRSKMLMEQEVARVRDKGALETVVIRAPWFYGPFQPPRQTRFFHMIRDGKAPIVGGGENRRSMAYMDNLVQGLLLGAVRAEAVGGTFWIADERPYTMNEIVDTVERLLEHEFGVPCRHKRMRLPGIFSDVAGVADRLIQAAGFYQQEIHVLSEMNKTIACSVDKARRVLGYAPEVALEEGMRRSLAWLVGQGVDLHG